MERWPYLLWGDERRDVRGDRRRVHFSMTAGCCRSLSTAASTECRAINAMAFLPRGRRKRRGRDRRCLVSHARAFSAHAQLRYIADPTASKRRERRDRFVTALLVPGDERAIRVRESHC